MTERDASASSSNSHRKSQTRLRILAAHFARALLRLSALSGQEGAGKAGCRLGTRGPLCAAHAKRTAQRHTGAAERPAFPARWVDGLCRALPGDEFVFVTVALRIDGVMRPGWALHASARLGRSNDGQDHTVLPYADSIARPRGAGLTGFGSILCPPCPSPCVPTPSASTAPHP